ncbi:MAG: T9SS type A sorting domain-containing protein [Flavobacteriales bacterium]|nr:T9SS type A sorting domain-containing protein [Flavobacteriales bacterium]
MKRKLLVLTSLMSFFALGAFAQCGGFTSSFNQQDPSCNGWGDGWAQVVPSGGLTPYMYNWDVGETDDRIDFYSAGVYFVTVIDGNACTITNSVTLTNPPAISVTYTTIIESCLGWDGSISVTPSGGNSPYNYNWYDNWWNPMGSGGPELNGLDSNSYQVQVVDANGCGFWETGILVSRELFNITITTNPTSACGASDGDATAAVIGGDTPYSYNWSNGGTDQSLTGLPAAIYIVTVTDNKGCMEGEGNAVFDPSGMTLNLSMTDVTCYGANDGMGNAVVTGGSTPYSYNWVRMSDGAPIGNTSTITGLIPDDYLLTVTDAAGCKTFDGRDVEQPYSPLNSSTWSWDASTNGASDGGGSIWANDGWNSGYTYMWDNGQTGSSVTGLTAGVYYVSATDAGGCVDVNSITLNEPAPCNPGGTIAYQDDNCSDWTGWATAPNPGGNAPVNYYWSTGDGTQTINNITAGVYTVTASSWGCYEVDVVTITSPLMPLGSNITTTDVSVCGAADGSAIAAGNGGTTSYSYLWNTGETTNSISGLVAQVVAVTVTDSNGCFTSSSQNLNAPSSISVLSANTSVTCGGDMDGTASVTVTGGVTPYAYNWVDDLGNIIGTSSSIIGLNGGQYSYTVTDSDVPACVSLGTEWVFENSAIQPNAWGNDITTWGGGSDGYAESNPNGGDWAYTYMWTGGGTDYSISGLAPGTYTVTVTDGTGCSAEETVTVSDPCANLTVSVTSTNDTCAQGEGTLVATVTGAQGGGYNYSWTNGTWNAPITDAYAGTTYNLDVWDWMGCSVTLPAYVTITGPAMSLNLSLTVNDVSVCGGTDGSASVVATGGNSGYTYLWNNGAVTPSITGQSAGAALVTVTDMVGCIESDGAPINDPGAPVVTITSVDATCWFDSDGSVTAVVTGGMTPYSYSWENLAGDPMGSTQTISGLPVDVYIVTVTDSNAPGCSAVNGIGLNSNPEIDMNVDWSSNPWCPGDNSGQAQISASDAAYPVTYEWANGDFGSNNWNLYGGVSIVTITDRDGCYKQFAVTLVDPPAISITTSTTDANCGVPDGTATATATGGAGNFWYNWSNGSGDQTATNLFAGNYTVTATDWNGCTETAVASVNNPNSPVLTVTTDSDPSCNGDTDGQASVSISGGTTPYTFIWANGQTISPATGLSDGFFGITVTDGANCQAASSATITDPVILSVNISTTDISYIGNSDGYAAAFPAGGTLGYSYYWNDNYVGWPNQNTYQTVTALANDVCVTVTDGNGCEVVECGTISSPACTLIISTSGNDALCNGSSDGDAFVNTFGGVSPFTYSWSNGGAAQATGNVLSANSYGVTVTDAVGCIQTDGVTISEPSMLSVTSSATDVSCNSGSDGSVSGMVSGGTSPYSYMWTGGSTASSATGLIAATYGLTVTDANGCIITDVSVVSEPAIMSITTSETQASCATANGSATAVGSGGTTAYSYLWTGGQATATATGFFAGSYDVTLTDANGCSITATQSVTNPGGPSVTVTGTNVTCNGLGDGTLSVSVTGGSAPYLYVWDDGVVNICFATSCTSGIYAGVYTLTVTDNNSCQANGSITITEPTTSLAITVTSSNVSCNGGTDGSAVCIAGGGTTPYAYSWNNGSTTSSQLLVLPMGPACLTVTDGNGCTQVACVTITEPTSLTVTAVQGNVSCNGGSDGSISLTTSGGTTAYSYMWNGGGTTAMASGLAIGVYVVTVTDGNGCMDISSYTITEPTMLSITTSTNDAACASSNGDATATVTGGTTPYGYMWNDGQATMMATGLTAGSFDVTTTDANGCTVSANALVNNPNSPSVTISVTDALCNGSSDGTATAMATGGTTPYNYMWTDGQAVMMATGLLAGNADVTVTDAASCVGVATSILTEPAALSLTTSYSDVSCNGGSNGTASVVAMGGTSPYTYTWDGGSATAMSTGLMTGNESVTVTDANGCMMMATETISEPAALTLTTTQTEVSCNGGNDGTATVMSSGGTTPYMYMWDSGSASSMSTGIMSGVESVTVTDGNGCMIATSVTITEPTALSIASSTTEPTCNGGSDGTASVVATGGTTAYSYMWNDGQVTMMATGLMAGSHDVTVSDINGCVIMATVTVTEPIAISVAVTVTDAACGGTDGTATAVTANGTTPYTYSWNIPGTDMIITGLPAGFYSADVTDVNGCMASGSSALSNVNAPTVTTAVITDVTCSGGSDGSAMVSATGGTGTNYTYMWDDVMNQTTATATGLSAGDYGVGVVDGAGCVALASVTVTEPDAIVINLTAMNVSCNADSDGAVTSMVSGGTTPYSYMWDGGSTDMMISGLATGGYGLTITDGSGCINAMSVTVSEPILLSLSVSTIDVNCNGESDGSVTVTAVGGTTPYMYMWSNGGASITETGLVVDSYNVTVTDVNGCMDMISATVSEPTILMVSTSITETNCGSSDGIATAMVSGGTTPYMYMWNNSSTSSSISGLVGGAYIVTVTDANGCMIDGLAVVTNIGGASVAIIGTNVSCGGASDGSAIAMVIGGATPYAYIWNDVMAQTTADATGLNGGVYSIVVTDVTGCISSGAITINEAALLVLSISSIDESCYGASDGTVAVMAMGGTSSYTYDWSPSGGTTDSESGLSMGTYTVTVTDASGCIDLASATITGSSMITITSATTDATCASSDGVASVSAMGDLTMFTYQWSDGVMADTNNAVAAGVYMVTATDANGCEAITSVTVSATSGSVTVTTTSVDVSCNGLTDGSVDAIATGGVSPYTYAWDNGPTNVGAGTYNVTVSDADGCTATASEVVVEPSAISITTSVTNESSSGAGNGEIVASATGGTGPLSYVWDNGQTTSTATGLTGNSTIYFVTATDANGCSVVAEDTVETNTGIEEYAAIRFEVYPNPNNGTFVVSLTKSGNYSMSVQNVIGQTVYSTQFTNQLSKEVRLGKLESGVYFITVKGEGLERTERIVVK